MSGCRDPGDLFLGGVDRGILPTEIVDEEKSITDYQIYNTIIFLMN